MKVLLDEGYLSITGNKTTAAPVPAASAKYIGPVAPMMVKRITLPENGLTKEEIDRTINTLSEEIEDDKDKEQFLKKYGTCFLVSL